MIEKPDVIIEVTNYCNRACRGCYAPNILTTQKDLLNKGRFISLNLLQLTLESFDTINLTCYIRGGEPTLHPDILNILIYLTSKFKYTYLETNGELFLGESEKSRNILDYKFQNKPIFKISYDSMHGLTVDDVLSIDRKLKSAEFEMILAVTEESETAFSEKISSLDYDLQQRCVYQNKVKTSNELIVPKQFVIDVSGTIKQTVTNRFSKTNSV